MPIPYPRVPGHEVAGVVEALGAGVSSWTLGQRVGVGWNGGYCGVCPPCRRGDLFACVTRQVTGLTYDIDIRESGPKGTIATPTRPGRPSVAVRASGSSSCSAAPRPCGGSTTP